MAAPIGSVSEFDNSKETWSTYIERLESFFNVNDIAQEKKSDFLVSVMGSETYGLLKNLMAPTKPSTKPFSDLVKTLGDHLDPQPTEMGERFRFGRRLQNEGESIASFVAELRHLSLHCGYGENLSTAIRDQFVLGLHSEATQKKLVMIKDLKLDLAIQTAKMDETATRDTGELHCHPSGASASASVHKLHTSQKKDKGIRNQGKDTYRCYRCNGRGHISDDCRFKDETCHRCGKLGHIKAACRSNSTQKSHKKMDGHKKHFIKDRRVHQMSAAKQDVGSSDSCDDYEWSDGLHTLDAINQLSKPKNRTNMIWVTPRFAGQHLKMEVDTGSAYSVIPLSVYKEMFQKQELQPTSVTLQTYMGELVVPVGKLRVKVQYKQQKAKLDLYVIEGGREVLFGRDWLWEISLDWGEIHSLKSVGETRKYMSVTEANKQVQRLLNKYKSVSDKSLGTLRGVKAQLILEDGAQPKFCRARNVPYAVKPYFEKELERLQEEGIISPIEYSPWASGVVPVAKRDTKDVRLCGDYKVTINPVIREDKFPLPRVEDIFAKMAGGKRFSKIDLKNTYLQMEVEETSKQCLTINTHKGLFQYNRLPFGIKTAQSIWQRAMEQTLQGIPNVEVMLDDIIVTGKSDAAHLETLKLCSKDWRRRICGSMSRSADSSWNVLNTVAMRLTKTVSTKPMLRLRRYRMLHALKMSAAYEDSSD